MSNESGSDRYQLINRSRPNACIPDTWIIYDREKDQILLITQVRNVAVSRMKLLLGRS